jgi:sulfite oxidase
MKSHLPNTSHSRSPVHSPLVDLGKDPRLHLHSSDPVCATPSAVLLDQFITPLDRLYVRNHFPLPTVHPDAWRLTIDGLVHAPFSIGLRELMKMPCSSYTALLTCAETTHGDRPDQSAAAQSNDIAAIGNLEWIGTPLALLFERVDLKRRAAWAACFGADGFQCVLPVNKLVDDVMLAYAANGKPIPLLHGGPVRLIVPGWNGTGWMKWPERISLIAAPSGQAGDDRIGPIDTGAIIISPQSGTVIHAGDIDIYGFAWSPGRGVSRVDLSFDTGDTWHPADLLTDLGPRAWRGFTLRWSARPGHYHVLARVVDGAGHGTTEPTAVSVIDQPVTFTVDSSQ